MRRRRELPRRPRKYRPAPAAPPLEMRWSSSTYIISMLPVGMVGAIAYASEAWAAPDRRSLGRGPGGGTAVGDGVPPTTVAHAAAGRGGDGQPGAAVGGHARGRTGAGPRALPVRPVRPGSVRGGSKAAATSSGGAMTGGGGGGGGGPAAAHGTSPAGAGDANAVANPLNAPSGLVTAGGPSQPGAVPSRVGSVAEGASPTGQGVGGGADAGAGGASGSSGSAQAHAHPDPSATTPLAAGQGHLFGRGGLVAGGGSGANGGSAGTGAAGTSAGTTAQPPGVSSWQTYLPGGGAGASRQPAAGPAAHGTAPAGAGGAGHAVLPVVAAGGVTTSTRSPGSLAAPSTAPTGGGASAAGSGASSPGPVAAAAAYARPAGGGAGGLVERAWRFRQQAPYDDPGASGHGARDAGEAPFQTLDALIIRYVDAALAAVNHSSSGTIPLTVATGNDGVGGYSFSVTVTYNFNESGLTSGGSFGVNDSASFSYSFHESGAAADGNTITLDDHGSATLTTTAGGSGTVHPLVESFSGSDNYTLLETQTLTGSGGTGGFASTNDTITANHAGSDAFTLLENRTETINAGGSLAAGSESYTWDEAGTDAPTLGDSGSEVATNTAGGSGETDSLTDRENSTAGHSLHATGDDAFGSDGLFTAGDRNYAFDESGPDTVTMGGHGPITVAATPGGGSQAGTYTTSESVSESLSLHQTGTEIYAASGSNANYTWDQHGSYTYTVTDTGNEAASTSENDADTEAAGSGVDAPTANETGTLTYGDIGTATLTLHEAGGQTLAGGTIASGSDSYTWGQTVTHSQHYFQSSAPTTTETGSGSGSGGGATVTGGGNDHATGWYSVTDTANDSATLSETGTETLGAGGVLTGGSATATFTDSLAATHSFYRLGTDTLASSGTESLTVGADKGSVTDTAGGSYTLTASESDTDTRALTQSTSQTFAAGGVLTGGGDAYTLDDNATNTHGSHRVNLRLETISSTESDSVGANSESFTVTDISTLTDTGGDSGTDYPSVHQEGGDAFAAGWLQAGGSLSFTLTDFSTDTITGVVTGTDKPIDTASWADVLGALTGSGHGGATDTLVESVTTSDGNSSTLSEMGSQSLGAGGAVLAGNLNVPLSSWYDAPKTTVSDSGNDATNESSNDTNYTGGPAVNENENDGATNLTTLTATYGPTATGRSSATYTLGGGGVVTGGSDSYSIFTAGGSTQTTTETDSGTATDTLGDVANDPGASLSEGESVTTTATDTATDTAVDARTSQEYGSHTYGIAGVLTTAWFSFTLSEFRTATGRDTGTGSDSVTGSVSDSNSDGLIDKILNKPFESLLFPHVTVSNSLSNTLSVYSTGSEAIGPGGTVSGGSVYESITDNGGGTDSTSESGTDTRGGTDSLGYAAGTYSHSDAASESGAGSSTITHTEYDPSSYTETLSETLGANGTIVGGNDSYTFYRSSGGVDKTSGADTLTTSETLFDGALLAISGAVDLGGSSVTIGGVVTVSGTATATLATETYQGFGTETLGAGGTIAAGSETDTLDRGHTQSYSTTWGDTATPESTTDTASGSGRVGTRTVTDTTSRGDSLHEVNVDNFGAGGSITDGSVTYTWGTSRFFSHTLHEAGNESLTDQVASSLTQTASFTQDLTATDSYSEAESGTETLAAGATITAGSDTFTYIDKALSAGTLHAAGASVTIDEAGTDSLTYSLTGAENWGTSATVSSGSDHFTWDQAGTDAYSIHQLGGGTHSYAMDLTDSVNSSWHDLGSDSLGVSDAILGGTDAYTWDKNRSETLGATDFGTPASIHSVAGRGFDSYTMHDAGGESLGYPAAGGVPTGSLPNAVSANDSYTWDESSSDSGAESQASFNLGNLLAAPGTLVAAGSDSYHDHDVGSFWSTGSVDHFSDSYTLGQMHGTSVSVSGATVSLDTGGTPYLTATATEDAQDSYGVSVTGWHSQDGSSPMQSSLTYGFTESAHTGVSESYSGTDGYFSYQPETTSYALSDQENANRSGSGTGLSTINLGGSLTNVNSLTYGQSVTYSRTIVGMQAVISSAGSGNPFITSSYPMNTYSYNLNNAGYHGAGTNTFSITNDAGLSSSVYTPTGPTPGFGLGINDYGGMPHGGADALEQAAFGYSQGGGAIHPGGGYGSGVTPPANLLALVGGQAAANLDMPAGSPAGFFYTSQSFDMIGVDQGSQGNFLVDDGAVSRTWQAGPEEVGYRRGLSAWGFGVGTGGGGGCGSGGTSATTVTIGGTAAGFEPRTGGGTADAFPEEQLARMTDFAQGNVGVAGASRGLPETVADLNDAGIIDAPPNIPPSGWDWPLWSGTKRFFGSLYDNTLGHFVDINGIRETGGETGQAIGGARLSAKDKSSVDGINALIDQPNMSAGGIRPEGIVPRSLAETAKKNIIRMALS